MARNGQQILGRELDQPVAFGLCWTPGGLGLGGTGQTLRIAKARQIPFLDLATCRPQRDPEAMFQEAFAWACRQVAQRLAA